MATRRSRLQIKPNILGGPKATSTKPSGKSLDTSKANSNETKESTGIKSPKVKSPTRVMSPRRGVAVNKPKDMKSGEKKEDDIKTDSKTTESESSVEKSVAVTTDQKSSDKGSTKPDTPVLPTRARLRKFGKVNVGAARGVKTDQTAAQNTPKIETAPENNAKSVTDTAVVTKNSNIDEKEQNSKREDNSKSSSDTSIPRRSRFPKAKPNIADIGRRKERVNATSNTNKTSQPSVQTEESSALPEITVTDTNEKTVNIPLKSHVRNEEQEVDLHHSDPLTVPAQTITVSTSSVVPKSPLKHPVPTIPITPEKRARTLSTSEPVVVKRQRKPKIDAPTDQPPDRSTMKMRDLIRWNPSNNPMLVSATNVNKKPDTSTEKEKENVIIKEPENPPSTNPEKAVEVEDDALPVPQVTIGPDGNIVINERSLVVKDPEREKAPSQVEDVIDETDTFTTYGSFRKSNRSKRWSEKETKKFYKALAMIGIDFFLICQLFPGRTRCDIKKKFQKEEKVNRQLVEKVLRERINFDPKMFDGNNEDSSEEEVKKPKKAKTKKPNDSNKPKDQQKTTKARSSRRRHRPNYYDDSDTSDENLERKRHKVFQITPGPDSPFQPPNVSQKDGEVVGILMDMSEGRLNNEGQNDSDEETFIATPLDVANINSNVNNSKTPINIIDKSSNNPRLSNLSNLRTREMEVGLSRPANEGIPIGNLGALQGVNTNIPSISQQGVSSGANSSLISPIANNNINIGTVNANSQQVQYRQNSVVNNPLSGLDVASLHPQSLLHRNPGLNTDDNDQYVLVTVVPEGGGETVIHVYRLHGGVAVETTESNPSQISPNSNPPQVLPELSQPQISTNSNPPQVLPELSQPQISTNSNPPRVLPELSQPQIFPNLESNQLQVLPVSEPSSILLQSE